MSNNYQKEATTFDATDAPSGRRLDGTESFQRKYRRLSLANTLDWNGKWRDERRATQRDSMAIVDAIAAQLELTSFQKKRARQFYTDLPDNYNQAYSSRLLAFVVAGIAGLEDGRKYHPNNLREGNADDDYAALADEVGTPSEIHSVWQRVRGEL